MPEHLFRQQNNIREVSLPLPERKRSFNFDVQPYFTEPVKNSVRQSLERLIQDEGVLKCRDEIVYARIASSDVLQHITISWPDFNTELYQLIIRQATRAKNDPRAPIDITHIARDIEAYKWLFPNQIHDRALEYIGPLLRGHYEECEENDASGRLTALRYLRTNVPTYFASMGIELTDFETMAKESVESELPYFEMESRVDKPFALESLYQVGVVCPSVIESVVTNSDFTQEVEELLRDLSETVALNPHASDMAMLFLQTASAVNRLGRQLIVTEKALELGAPILLEPPTEDSTDVPIIRSY